MIVGDTEQIVISTPQDAHRVAEIFYSARAEMRYLPRIHSSEETYQFFSKLIHDGNIPVCKVGDEIVGFMELENGWLHHLYIAPQFQNKGFGTMMLDYAKRKSPQGIKLWVFEDNKNAIRFYEREGFILVKKRNIDETTNEENLPDRLYEWRPNDKNI